MNHIEWKDTNGRAGPVTTYGYWEGAKCFSIFYDGMHKHAPNAPRYVLKSMLPGFRPDLPMQRTVSEAQAFAERMLQRWAAKRGLLFKSHIVVTDAMKQAAIKAAHENMTVDSMDDGAIEAVIKAALEARG